VVHVSDIEINEGDDGVAVAFFEIKKTGMAPTDLEVVTERASATPDEDYEHVAELVHLDETQDSLTIPVRIVGDQLREGDETFSLRVLSATGGVAVADAVGIGVIRDDDGPLGARGSRMFGISGTTLAEGPSGRRSAAVAVTLSAPSPIGAEVAFTTQPLEASPGRDFVTIAGLLRFGPGERYRTLHIPILGDGHPERDESLRVVLKRPINADIGVGAAIVTIIDDDVRSEGPRRIPSTLSLRVTARRLSNVSTIRVRGKLRPRRRTRCGGRFIASVAGAGRVGRIGRDCAIRALLIPRPAALARAPVVTVQFLGSRTLKPSSARRRAAPAWTTPAVRPTR
jgi:hypothetical protein